MNSTQAIALLGVNGSTMFLAVATVAAAVFFGCVFLSGWAARRLRRGRGRND